MVSLLWSIDPGGKGDEEHLPFIAVVPVGEHLASGYRGCHFLLSVACCLAD